MSNAYDEGLRAGRKGVQQHTCPYVPNSADYEDWIDGWKDGLTELHEEAEENSNRKWS